MTHPLQGILWDIRPHDGCGPLKFGMSPDDVTQKIGAADQRFTPKVWEAESKTLIPSPNEFSQLRENSPWHGCTFVDGELAVLEGDFDALTSLCLGEEDLNRMNRLEAALYLTGLSTSYGQAQGGSLYYEDLGLAILQYETPHREIVIWRQSYPQNEPLRPMTPDNIIEYFTSQSQQILSD